MYALFKKFKIMSNKLSQCQIISKEHIS